MTESTEVLPQRFQVVRKLPTRMSRSAWGCPCPHQEKVGTCSSSPGCVVLWRTIARGGEGWSAAGSCWSTSSCGGGVDAVSNERWRHPPGGPRACDRRVQWRMSLTATSTRRWEPANVSTHHGTTWWSCLLCCVRAGPR